MLGFRFQTIDQHEGNPMKEMKAEVAVADVLAMANMQFNVTLQTLEAIVRVIARNSAVDKNELATELELVMKDSPLQSDIYLHAMKRMIREARKA